MCAIAGIVSSHINFVTQDKLQQMAAVLQHRGNDAEGFWVNDTKTIGFAHKRLSIIDLSENAAQPMHFPLFNKSNEIKYTIVYNGEIYNYIELREELKTKGYTFKTQSDTEVLLALYDCYNENFLNLLDGMFAFAIWDNEQNKLFIARDRFGEKPLYYCNSNDQFLFASEMKALWEVGIDKEINHTLFLNYLIAGLLNNPTNASETFYNNIKKLPAAHAISYVVQSKKINVYQYWNPTITSLSEKITEKEVTEKFVHLFNQSVARRLRSDVAIATSLSGGLDSSSILATIAQFLPENSLQNLQSFSAVFPNFEKDESKYITLVTDKFKIKNTTVTPTAEEFAHDFEKLLYHQEEPFQSSSIYVQYKVYELAKEHGVKVLLDGQGADEILAGYTKYYHWYWQELFSKGKFNVFNKEKIAAAQHNIQVEWGFKNIAAAVMPVKAAKQISKSLYNQIQNNSFLEPDFIHHSINKNSLEKPVIRTLNDILYYNTFTNGLEDLLRFADRNAMAHGREIRLPFLNHELVEFIFSLPSHFKIRNGFSKYVLRNAMKETLPKEIVWRKDKIGFEPPQQQWLQHKSIEPLMQQAKQKLISEGILKKNVLQKPLETLPAHASNNFSWWILCAGNLV